MTAPTSAAGLAARLPSWVGSIRFRLAVLYAALVFALSAVVTGGVYVALSVSLSEEPVSQTYNVFRLVPTPQGTVQIPEGQIRAANERLEAAINDHTLAELRQWSLVALVVGAFAGVGIGWFAAGRVLRPVHRITGVARDIQASDLSRRIALDGPDDEMKELADTFDGMLGRLDEAFEGQRHFFQEASHELRNPLAVIRTNLDVALADDDASAEDLRRAAELAARTAERMTHTVDDLLRYARNEQAVMQVDDVDLALLVEEVVDEFRSPAATRSLTVAVAEAPGPVEVRGDRAALRQALANLLDNAVRLAPEGSTITAGAGIDGPWAWMAVTDEGPGIVEEEQPLVFRRFWRGSARDGERGSGLGLAIVDQILLAHGGAARVASEPGQGSVFSLWLPRDHGTEAPREG
jgi:signal transduction histidine kinase